MATSMAESLELSDALVRGSNTSHRNHLVFRGPPVPNHRQLHHSQKWCRGYSLWRRIPHFLYLVQHVNYSFHKAVQGSSRFTFRHYKPLSCCQLSSHCHLPSHPCCSSFPSESSTSPFRRYLFSVVIVLLPHLPLRHPPLRPSSPFLRASDSNTYIHHYHLIVSSPSSL